MTIVVSWKNICKVVVLPKGSFQYCTYGQNGGLDGGLEKGTIGTAYQAERKYREATTVFKQGQG